MTWKKSSKLSMSLKTLRHICVTLGTWALLFFGEMYLRQFFVLKWARKLQKLNFWSTDSNLVISRYIKAPQTTFWIIDHVKTMIGFWFISASRPLQLASITILLLHQTLWALKISPDYYNSVISISEIRLFFTSLLFIFSTIITGRRALINQEIERKAIK